MSEPETLTYRGIELNIEDLRNAIEDITDERGWTGGRLVVRGGVVLDGDGYTDADVWVANVSDLDRIPANDEDEGVINQEKATFTSVGQLETEIEEATGSNDFAEFVDNEISGIEIAEGTAYSDNGVVLDVTTYQSRPTFGSNTGHALDEHDDIGVGYIAWGDGFGEPVGDREEPQLRIGLRDERDE